ncbi:hypothetical protein ES319_1Z207800v1 [Gossypium barbadense]|uniref:Uncharacterized protein n=1 Tax=Gossypium barbadense TaxID=3634 RepID=A0A5J5NFX3_GOSBA|nr:hypothetical protein ES319_1Z207800v1 [Gossypium barbadense]
MEAINAKGVNMIGMHGMPGVGKTTLAKEVGKHAREQKLFDKVVMFTMSQNPNIRTIQDKVAEMFGLKFHTNTEEGRAEELFRSMKGVNKILVIVDDLWEEFKLEDIGIPFGDDHKGCKILLTTRQQQVCSKMKCQKEIQLGILSKDEAWVLFRDKAGLEDDCSTLNDVAKEVAAECKGLPLAIVVVAKALKGESLNGWRDANQRFKDSTHLYDEEVFGGVLEPLKLSYDYLKKGSNQMTGINDIQMCFLLCSLFPEDEEIDTEILITCGIGVGLFPYVSLIEDKRKKIVEALKKLQKSGLLLESGDAKSIRIHDVIRDFAHWLTSRGENRFMVKDTLEEWPHMDESYTAIALWNCSSIIKKFPDKMEFSKLKTLFLKGERKRKRDDFLEVFGTFFEEMKALQVLLLQLVSFELKGFPSLPNLKTLWCYNCRLKNFSSSLTNMRSLEILALIGTEIDEISEELVKLSALKYLRLSSEFEELEEFEEFEEFKMNIPPNLVSRLTSLQELHVITANNLNLLELKSLSRLTALSLELSANQIPLEDFVLPKLQRYGVVVGEIYAVKREAFIRTLYIQDFSSSLSAFNNLFCNVEELDLLNVGGQKNIVPSIDEMGVNELTSLRLGFCDDMEFLIDTKNDQGSTVAFSNLVELKISSMVSLKGLCYGVSPTRFLQKLKQVSIRDCEELQVIFQIDKLSERMKYQTPLLPNLTELSLHSLPKLKMIWEVKPSHRAIASLQSLKVVRIESCHNLKTIFSPCLALSKLHLQELYVRHCDRLEQVIGFGQEGEIIENDCLLYCWRELRVLSIHHCESLKYIFTNTLIQSLESVYIENCHQLIQIYNMEQNIVLPELGSQESLTNLKLILLPELKYMWNVPNHYLHRVEITRCDKLTYLFSEITARTLVHLQFLEIRNCYSLEHLIGEAENMDEIDISNTKDQSPLFLPNLKGVRIANCENLKYLCSSQALPYLESIEIEDCPRLIQIFNMEKNKDGFGLQGFPLLESIYLSKCPQLLHVFKNDSSLCCWPKLRSLRLQYCPNLKYVFATTWTQELQSLESVFITECSQLIQVFNMEQNKHGQDIVLPELGSQEPLTNLTLSELKPLPELKYHYPNLHSVNEFTYLFPEFTARTLVHLQFLEIRNCYSLEHLIGEAENMDEIDISNTKDQSPLFLPNLKGVRIANCENLKYLCSSQALPYLESIEIEDCPRLIQIFNMEKNKDGFGLQGFPLLESIYLSKCPQLLHVFKNDSSLCCWPKLRSLRLQYCPNLKYVFATTWTQELQSLESVFITECSQLIQVFNMEQNKHGQDIVLPELGSQESLTNLTFLELRSLPELKYMWNGPNHYLHRVEITKCDKLTYLFSEITARTLVHLQFLEIWNCYSLEHLIGEAENMDEIGVSNIKDQSSLFLPKLEVVKIRGCENLKYLCSSQGLPYLESIEIEDCPRLIQIFNMEKNKDGFGLQNDSPLCCWPKLRILHIEFCPKLKYVCANTWTRGLQSLESVFIRDCSQLIQVFNMEQNKHGQDIVLPELGSQNHCWTKLKTLQIEDCQLLKYVFANTLSQGFPLLESLYLKNCPQLLQVFSSTEERDVIGDHILLNVPFLKNLEVSNCPQISCFIVQAQLIEELVLSNVGNSCQLCNTDVPVLNEGCIVVGNHEEVFQVQGGYSFSSIKKLKLRNLFEARVIWNDFAQVVTLENLTTLTLSDCKKLRYIFSPMMARSLSHLVDLFIEGCEEIERIILAKDQVSSSSSNGDTSHQPKSFRNLTRITVTNCKNLNSLFPFGLFPVVSKLESLIVERNSKLEQVFELEEKVEVVAKEKMKFYNLERLLLEELPGLIQFCPKGYHFVFPKMMELKVRDCPKLTTGFFIDSQAFVHCKTKLVEQDAVEESTTVQNAIFNENIDWYAKRNKGTSVG